MATDVNKIHILILLFYYLKSVNCILALSQSLSVKE